MNNSPNLYLAFFSDPLRQNAFFIHFFGDEMAEQDMASAFEVVQKKYPDLVLDEGMLGPFRDEVDLSRFALSLLTDIHREKAFLISKEVWNRSLEEITHINELFDILKKYGNPINDPDFQKKKSTLLDKFFRS